MVGTLSLGRLRLILVAPVRHLPDHRTRANRLYGIADAALGAFAVFFIHSPSFLAHQQDMQRSKGQNNAQSLFGIDEAPSDPQIRNVLDRIPLNSWPRRSGECSSNCGTATPGPRTMP